MMHRTHTTKAGFTMIELIVAIAISSIVTFMAIAAITNAITHTRTITAEAHLIEAATSLTHALSFSIRPGASVEVPTSQRLIITQPDYSTITIEYDGSDILYDGDVILNENITPTNLNFTKIENTIQVAYELHADIGSAQSVDPIIGTTTIALRN